MDFNTTNIERRLKKIMLELRNISKQYISSGGNVQALENVNLQFRQTEFVSILGPS